jgi:hypothetical protein
MLSMTRSQGESWLVNSARTKSTDGSREDVNYAARLSLTTGR